MMEKTSSSPVAATPASMNTTPDKPKTASEHRKVSIFQNFLCTCHPDACYFSKQRAPKHEAAVRKSVFYARRMTDAQ